ncbi:MAG: helix-turn-helix domain-containing protein [Eubacterium sp.]|nr:helix-turn-helix domain-containing protein [Eubacterium sp.]
MIFADKLIQLRKQKGWSQEELAEKLDVTRQSVSKWESAQSVPDLERILQISEMFDVSLDYLLKENNDKSKAIADVEGNAETCKTISLEEAKNFIKIKKSTAVPLAIGVFLCIISPICLIILGALNENDQSFMSENMAVGLGVIVLLVLIAVAVSLFIYIGSKTSAYEYLEKEIIEIDFKTSEMVRNEKEDFRKKFVSYNIIGTALCVLASIPLFLGLAVVGEDDLLLIVASSVTIFIIAVGVFFFVRANTIQSAFNIILQEGDYSKDKKKKRAALRPITVSYWLIVTAIFLAWSFITNKWDLTWIVWPVAGVLYPVLLSIVNLVIKRK